MPSSPRSRYSKAAQDANSKSADRKANRFNQSIVGPLGNELLKGGYQGAQKVVKGITTTQRMSQKVLDKAASQVAGDVRNMAQFGSKAAKEVVKDVQGLAKMVMKGFGN